MPTLEQQLEEFRRRIDSLEALAQKAAGALQLAPHQTGPRPGWFRAARIEGTQMILDFSASQAGVSPRISVTDTTGVTRAEMGNLASYTGPNGVNSPAMYGFRANDATGNAIFDSLGLIAVMKVLINGGTQTVGPITGVAGPPTGLSGFGGEVVLTTGGFTLTRPGTVLLIGLCTDYVLVTGPGQVFNSVYFQTDGVSESGTAYADIPVWPTPGTAETRPQSVPLIKVSTLTAGSHTVNIIWNSFEGANDVITNVNNALFAFQLGF